MAKEPSEFEVAEWILNTPNPLNSVEQLGTSGKGPLTTAYTTGVDGRGSETCLGPEFLAIDLSGAGGTTANAHMAAYVTKSASEHFLYIARGTIAAKYKIDDASVTGNGITLAGECTSLIATEGADGTPMISYGLEDDQATTYHNSTAIGTGANDANSANDEALKTRFFGQGDNQRVFGLGGNGNATRIKGNILTGVVNMDASNWGTIKDVIGPVGLKMTGFALDDLGRPIVGTNYGPYTFNPETGAFRAIIQEGLVSPDDENCRGMKYSTLLGVHIPLRHGARYLKNDTTRSWGVNQFKNNKSPVFGPFTAFTSTKDKTMYSAVRDESGSDTYIVAWRPADDSDIHTERFTPFVIGKLASNAKSLFMHDIGTANGALTNPMIVAGRDTNALSFLEALTADPWDDSGYRFAASGTWFGTELRRNPLDFKVPVAWTFESKDCSATVTLQLYVSVDGKARQKVGSVVKSNQVNMLSSKKGLKGHTLTPSIDFVTGSNQSSPRVKGSLKLFYRTIPLRYDGHVLEEVK